jgi:antitoxin component of RelBE/YafQ-DinJ toxin-antitoxin module
MYYFGTDMGAMKTKEKNTERISTFLTKEVLEELKQEAKKRGLTVSSLIRMLILECIREKEKG